MRIGIAGAMGGEVDQIKELMTIDKEEIIAGRTYYSGKIFSDDVTLVVTKIGKVSSAQGITTLIQTFGCDFILFAGTAGGASLILNVGDIVMGSAFIQHDMDLSSIGNPRFEIPVLKKIYFYANTDDVQNGMKAAKKYISEQFKDDVSTELAASVQISNPKVYSGTIASGDRFMADSDEVRKLFDQIEDLKCVEMESGAAAQVCYENNVPLLVIRIVSDKANEHADIDFGKFLVDVAGVMIKGCVYNLLKG